MSRHATKIGCWRAQSPMPCRCPVETRHPTSGMIIVVLLTVFSSHLLATNGSHSEQDWLQTCDRRFLVYVPNQVVSGINRKTSRVSALSTSLAELPDTEDPSQHCYPGLSTQYSAGWIDLRARDGSPSANSTFEPIRECRSRWPRVVLARVACALRGVRVATWQLSLECQ